MTKDPERNGANGGATAEQLRSLEESLLDPLVRRDRERLRTMLATDFLEFGSSGRVWNRNTIIELLSIETKFIRPAIEDFQCAQLSDAVALVTYRTVRNDDNTGERLVSLRSSIWTRESGEWQMRFHQGTRTG